MSPELLAKLKKLAERECLGTELSWADQDDAYWDGYYDGQAKLALEILKELELPEEPPF